MPFKYFYTTLDSLSKNHYIIIGTYRGTKLSLGGGRFPNTIVPGSTF